MFTIGTDEVPTSTTFPPPPPVEVEYLFPCESKRVVMVPDGVRSTVVEAIPPARTENTVELFSWKLIKSRAVVVGFAPMYVPFTLPPIMKFGPKRKSEEVAVVAGLLFKNSLAYGQLVPLNNPILFVVEAIKPASAATYGRRRCSWVRLFARRDLGERVTASRMLRWAQ